MPTPSDASIQAWFRLFSTALATNSVAAMVKLARTAPAAGVYDKTSLMTPIEMAVCAHQAQAVESLLDHAAQKNQPITATVHLRRPLLETALLAVPPSPEIVELLLQNGLDPNESCIDGGDHRTLLCVAIENSASDPRATVKIVKALLNHGADPNAPSYLKYTDGLGVTPLASSLVLLAPVGGHIAQVLLSADADPRPRCSLDEVSSHPTSVLEVVSDPLYHDATLAQAIQDAAIRWESKEQAQDKTVVSAPSESLPSRPVKTRNR